METVWSGLVRLSRAGVIAGCALLLLAAFIVTAEVLVRKAVPDLIDLVQLIVGLVGIDLTAAATSLKVAIRDRLTFSGSDELSGYLFAVGTSWSMAHVLITRGHVRIDVVYGRLPPKVRAVLDIIALVLLTVFVAAVLERAYDVALTNYAEWNRSNTNLRIPLAYAQIPWLIGIALFFLAAVVAILRSLLALAQGDLATVNSTAGVSTQDEEIESELKGLGIETPHGGKK